MEIALLGTVMNYVTPTWLERRPKVCGEGLLKLRRGV
jgi:hypothetical protein